MNNIIEQLENKKQALEKEFNDLISKKQSLMTALQSIDFEITKKHGAYKEIDKMVEDLKKEA